MKGIKSIMKWTSNEYLYTSINEFLTSNNITDTVDLKNICNKYDWALLPYDYRYMDKLYEISPDGFTACQNGKYYIMYALISSIQGNYRQRFTIAHEIGHIVLNHHKYIDNNILRCYNSPYKPIWEKHADIFAHNLLMPADRTRELKDKITIDELAKHFKVSRTMAMVRLQKLREDELNFRRLKTKEVLSVADRSKQYGSYFFKS